MKKYFTPQNIGLILLIFGVTVQIFGAVSDLPENWMKAAEIIWPIGLLIWAVGEMQKKKTE